MLRIRQIHDYHSAKYPRGVYYSRPTPEAIRYLRQGTISAALLLMLEACDGPGGVTTSGVPAIDPLTEVQARNAIRPVFVRNGIQLVEDVDVAVEVAAGDTIELELDGYNDSLEVGYEYMGDYDYLSFTYNATRALDSLINDGGPYIKVLGTLDQSQEEYADYLMQEFIDSLRAQGVI